MGRPLNAQGRKAQADCLRRFLGAAEGYGPESVEETAQQVERGDVEFDPEWLETLAGGQDQGHAR